MKACNDIAKVRLQAAIYHYFTTDHNIANPIMIKTIAIPLVINLAENLPCNRGPICPPIITPGMV